jgi:2,5-diketo-D-gluconate reductase A
MTEKQQDTKLANSTEQTDDSVSDQVTDLPANASIPPTPLVKLSDGRLIPQIGLGVLRIEKSETVEQAIRAGYRHIDTAAGYNNEQIVGQALESTGFASGPKRSQMWVTTKVKDTEQGFDSVLRACDRQLRLLRTDYVDMYMIHWPTPFKWRSDQTWKAFERLQGEGLVRSLGVCNFLPEHLQRLYDETGQWPVVDQIELHPTFQQRDVVEFCRQHGIAVEAYEPLARTADLHAGNGLIDRIAAAHHVSCAQVILRWHLENGTIIIPKSVHLNRQIENANLTGFALTPQEHAAIDALDTTTRVGHDPMTFSYA